MIKVKKVNIEYFKDYVKIKSNFDHENNRKFDEAFFLVFLEIYN